MRPLILCGGPAVGKSTCSRTLARSLDRCVAIDVDDVRQFVVGGIEALWTGPEGESQSVLAARNVCALGRNFGKAGFDVTIADFLTSSSLAVYRDELPDCFIVFLQISISCAKMRAKTRPVYLSDEEFIALHRMAMPALGVDLVIDVEGMTFEDQLERIRDAWFAA